MNWNFMTECNLPICGAMIKYTGDWAIKDVTPMLCKYAGLTKEQLIAYTSNKERFFYANDLDLFEKSLEVASEGKSVEACSVRIQTQKGIIWVKAVCQLYCIESAVPYISVIFYDISDQKENELKLRLLNERQNLVDEISMEQNFDVDVVNWRMYIPDAGYDADGTEIPDFDGYVSFSDGVKLAVHPLDQAEFVHAMKVAAGSEVTDSIEYRVNENLNHGIPRYEWYRTFYRSVKGEDDRIIRVVGRSYNIDQDKVLKDEVRRDPLTNLLNKTETRKEIEALLEKQPNRNFVLFIIDVDNFKQINDTFGHTYGDNVIMEVASVLRDQFRSDDVVGRVGGDEFVVLMHDTTMEKAVERAKTLCELLEKSYTGGTVTKYISASIGLAEYGVDGITFERLFEKADHAMYRVKEGGKNGYEIAHAEDKGPMKPRKKEMESRISFEIQDRDFLFFAVSLMAHAKNIDGSLNMLLKSIAMRFELTLVGVFEEVKDKDAWMLTNYYSDTFDFYERMVFPKNDLAVDDLYPGETTIVTREKHRQKDLKINAIREGREWTTDGMMTMVIGKFEYVGERNGVVYFLSADGERGWADNEVELLGELVRVISIFVALRHRMDEGRAQIRSMQRRDQLTGLYTLEAFKETVASILREPEPGALYAFEYLDINNFGYVNENYGYMIGDNALKSFVDDVSEQKYFRAGCRLYSDFFLFLVCGESREEIEHLLNVQHKKFANMQNHQYPSSSMSISSGLYVFDLQKYEIDEALENAVLAWKKAKNNRGRGIVFFREEFRQSRAKEQQVIGEFYEALYRDDFRLYLQPKFILGERTVYGAEALARWKLPDGGVVMPGEFLSPLERIGYITELDFYIFEELLKNMNRWIHQGKRAIVVSTNFSGRHFENGGEEFLRRISFLIHKYDVEPRYIEIEVTEGVLVKNLDALKTCIDKLHEMGFRVAIDDFGTGYSSLSVLMDVFADVVKMDKSFLEGGITERQRELLVQIEKLIHVAGKESIFEGVETEEQEKFLMECGYTHGQGYLLDRPIRIDEFEKKYL